MYRIETNVIETDKFAVIFHHEKTELITVVGVEDETDLKWWRNNMTPIGVWQPKGTKFHSTYVPTIDTSQPITRG